MKSNSQILMDFNNAKRQAARLEDAARSIRRESGRMSDCRNDVSAAWSGDNASKFIAKMGIVSEDLEKIASSLEKTAEVIRKNAKTMYDAEMEAKRIAEERTHFSGGGGGGGGGGRGF